MLEMLELISLAKKGKVFIEYGCLVKLKILLSFHLQKLFLIIRFSTSIKLTFEGKFSIRT